MSRASIRIIAVPPGEAPLEVRQAWVGLMLPLRWPRARPRTFLTSGVLSGPRSFLARLAAILRGRVGREQGYAVRVTDAIEVLERSRPDAAAWWRRNTPHLLASGRHFVFAAEVCTEEPQAPVAPS